MKRLRSAARLLGGSRGTGIRQQAPVAPATDEDPLSSNRKPQAAM